MKEQASQNQSHTAKKTEGTANRPMAEKEHRSNRLREGKEKLERNSGRKKCRIG